MSRFQYDLEKAIRINDLKEKIINVLRSIDKNEREFLELDNELVKLQNELQSTEELDWDLDLFRRA